MGAPDAARSGELTREAPYIGRFVVHPGSEDSNRCIDVDGDIVSEGEPRPLPHTEVIVVRQGTDTTQPVDEGQVGQASEHKGGEAPHRIGCVRTEPLECVDAVGLVQRVGGLRKLPRDAVFRMKRQGVGVDLRRNGTQKFHEIDGKPFGEIGGLSCAGVEFGNYLRGNVTWSHLDTKVVNPGGDGKADGAR